MQKRFLRNTLILVALLTLGVGLALSYFFSLGNRVEHLRLTLKGPDRYHFQCLAFSPDSKLIAAGQTDGSIHVWRTANGDAWVSVPPEQGASVTCVAFSPGGESLAWGDNDKTVRILDLKAKKVIARLGQHGAEITDVRFHPNREILASATGIKEGIVRFWDLEKNEATIVWDAKKSKYCEPDEHRVSSIAFDAAGKTMAVGIFGGVVFLDLTKNASERAASKGFPTMPKGLTFVPNGKHAAGITDKVTFWDPDAGKEVMTIENTHRGLGFRFIAFSPDGKLLAIGLSGGARKTSFVQIWDVVFTREVLIFPSHQDSLAEVAWSPDGKTLATCSGDATVKLWDVAAMLKGKTE